MARSPYRSRNHTPNRTERDQARRTLSQNLLHRPDTAARIVEAARLDPAALVVEVGAGRGALTFALAPRCRQVIAYEIDRRLAAALRARAERHPNVRCVPGDFLTARPPREPFAVVANVPFARTADVVVWCLRAPLLRSATLVTQLEYARRRSGDFGRWTRLTVETWPRFHWELAGRVPRWEFRPVPGVDGGILRLERRPQGLLPEGAAADYRRLVRLGFSGYGGSVYRSLRRGYPARPLAAAWARAGLDRETLAGAVSPGDWLTLFRLLHHAGSAGPPPPAQEGGV